MKNRLLMFVFAAVTALLAGSAVGVTAKTPAPMLQTLTNPTTVTFTVSPDHDVVANTVSVVSSYLLEAFRPDGTLVKTADIGKGTAVAGTITYTGLASFTSTLPPNTYTLKVAAKGPGGESARSAASAPFDVTIPAPRAPGAPVPK